MAYSSSKRALNGIIKHLSLEKGGEADFIGIAPSQVDSKQLREKIPESKIKELIISTSMGLSLCLFNGCIVK